MTSTATTTPATRETPPGTRERDSGTLLPVIRSEWTKLWSLRSTPWTLVTMFVVTVAFSALASWGAATHLQQTAARSGGHLDPTNIALAGLLFGQLPIAVLGVLVISGEYSTGSIRGSLTAVPGRLRLLTGKAVVLTVLALLGGLVTSVVSFYTGTAFFAAHGAGVGIGDPHVLRAVVGGGLLVAGCALLGFAVGTLLRHTAGSITVSVALLFVIPLVLGSIPGDTVAKVNMYFLTVAGGAVTQVAPRVDMLGPWVGYLVFLAEIAAVLLAGAIVMRRRDA